MSLANKLRDQLDVEEKTGSKDYWEFIKVQDGGLRTIKKNLSDISTKLDGMESEVLYDVRASGGEDVQSKMKQATKILKGQNRNIRLVTDAASYLPEVVMIDDSRELFYKGQKGDVKEMMSKYRKKMKADFLGNLGLKK